MIKHAHAHTNTHTLSLTHKSNLGMRQRQSGASKRMHGMRTKAEEGACLQAPGGGNGGRGAGTS